MTHASRTARADPIDLVIFDCDGVLVDSEPISNQVFADLLGEVGIVMPVAQVIERFVGRTLPACVAMIEADTGRSLPADFVATLRVRTLDALRNRVLPMPGIEQVLDGLTIPYCVASSGLLEKMRVTLGTTGLLSRFQDHMFSASQVAHGKPWPDLFLFAALRMDVPPARCVVVEDSVVGVQAGVAAGMAVIGFGTSAPHQRLLEAGAVLTIENMAQLPSALASLAGGA